MGKEAVLVLGTVSIRDSFSITVQNLGGFSLMVETNRNEDANSRAESEFPMNEHIKEEMSTLGIFKICLIQYGEHAIPNGLIVYFISADLPHIECKYYSRHMKQTLYTALLQDKPCWIAKTKQDCSERFRCF